MFRILVVDDSLQIVEYLKILLSWHGYGVTKANGGLEGKHCFDAAEFDLVISDICMPEFDGNALARYVKSSSRPVPVLALTGSVEMACEAFDWIQTKPIRSKTLLDIVDMISANSGEWKTPATSLQRAG